MPRLKRLAAREIVRFLGRFEFKVISIRGSHAKLVRIGPSGGREILIGPINRQLATGTVHAIYRQASRFIPEEELRQGFFTD